MSLVSLALKTVNKRRRTGVSPGLALSVLKSLNKHRGAVKPTVGVAKRRITKVPAERRVPKGPAPAAAPLPYDVYTGETIAGNAAALEYVDKQRPTRSTKLMINGHDLHPFVPVPRPWTTDVRVVQDDTLHAAAILASKSSVRPAVLNFANPRRPGGGARNTLSNAQEESICYRTDMLVQLEEAFAAQRDPSFVMDEYDAFWLPEVTVFLGPKQRNGEYPVLAKQFEILVISAAAPYHPEVSGDRYALPKDLKIMEDKMRLVLRMALTNRAAQGVNIVLGAWGCGEFGNPPRAVAELWRQLLLEDDEFKGQFHTVLLAVQDAPTFKVFQQVFRAPAVPRIHIDSDVDDDDGGRPSAPPAEPSGGLPSAPPAEVFATTRAPVADPDFAVPPVTRPPTGGLYGPAHDLLMDLDGYDG